MAAPNPKNCLLTWDKKRLSHTLLGISMEQRTSRWVLTLTLHRSEISVFERCSYVVTEGCCYVMPDVVLAKLNNFTSLGVVENANFSRALYVIQGVVSQLMRVRWVCSSQTPGHTKQTFSKYTSLSLLSLFLLKSFFS